MRELRFKILAFGISFSLLSTIQVMAASLFESPPGNLKALEQKISESLVGVTCQTTSIGYSEDVVITEENKNNGNNSYIVTSYRALLPCINNRNLPVTVTYKGKNYKAEVWGWSANASDDFASVMTTVYVPPIPDWSRYRPERNWWLLYAQWGEGILLTDSKKPEPVFSNTTVYTVNERDFTLSASPLPFKVGLMKHGYFFDIDGNFVGSLKWVYDKDPISIAGFPRICSVAGGSSSDRSLLNCRSTREQLWGTTATANAAAELKAKQEAEARAAAELKAKQEAEAAAKAAVVEKKTITCKKGMTVKKVTALKPKCPTGYKKK
jgi:hypothetical protein